MNRPGLALTVAVLSGCAFGPGAPPSDAADTVSRASAPDADGRCWASEPVPAIYEQVMGEIQVVQAEIAEDGTVLRPPVYRRAPVPRVVRPRGEFVFEAPCAATLTEDFVASLQRALAARGLLDAPATGRLDAATRAAIAAYQAPRGLESDQLSVETARSLGLIAIERSGPSDDA